MQSDPVHDHILKQYAGQLLVLARRAFLKEMYGVCGPEDLGRKSKCISTVGFEVIACSPRYNMTYLTTRCVGRMAKSLTLTLRSDFRPLSDPLSSNTPSPPSLDFSPFSLSYFPNTGKGTVEPLSKFRADEGKGSAGGLELNDMF